MAEFKNWFENAGGQLSASVGITEFPGMGRGAIALETIPEGSTLFTIPRSILLSTRTTTLRETLGEPDWAALGSGWQPLIVSMMWEESRGVISPWNGYLSDLPNQFDTPMFWSEDELDQLQASTIRDKIGRAEAERSYLEGVLPVIRRRADVFDPALVHSQFSMERFHINGSRILSRSFNVEDWESEENSDHSNNSDHHSPMDDDEENVDTVVSVEDTEATHIAIADGDVDENEDEEKEEVDHVAMVPMADILNARYGCENAKLYYEKDLLRMISTKNIALGEQIWNTYGDPPNAHLLRRYGHVDLIPVDVEPTSAVVSVFPFENPADEVEIRADLVLDICARNASEESKKQKIEIWLSLGGEDTFAIDKDDLLCKPLLGMIRYLSMDESEVQEAIEKDKIPKGKPSGEALTKAIFILRARLTQYATCVEEDEAFLHSFQGSPSRIFNAVFVRFGEKRLLNQAIEKAGAILDQETAVLSRAKLKRTREDERGSRRDRKKLKR